MDDKIFEYDVAHWYDVGKGFFTSGDYEKAIEVLGKVADLEHGNAECLGYLGASYHLNGELEKAIEAFKRAVVIEPENSMRWSDLGNSYCLIDEFIKAIDAYKKSVAIEPQNKEYWNMLSATYDLVAISYILKEENEEIIKVFKEAMQIEPKTTKYWNIVGKILNVKGEYEKAIEMWEGMVQVEPENADYWDQLGVAYRGNGYLWESIEAFRMAVHISPRCSEYWGNLGISYGLKCDHEEAIDAFEKATKIKPEKEILWSSLGIAYYSASEYESAIKALNEAIKIDPENSEFWYDLAVIHITMGNYNDAFKCLDTGKSSKKIKESNIIPALNNILSQLAKGNNQSAFKAVVEKNFQYLGETEFAFFKDIFTLFPDLAPIKDHIMNVPWHIQKIMNKLALDTSTKSSKRIYLAHYTKIENINLLIKKEEKLQDKEPETSKQEVKNKLRLNHSSYMNDPSEGLVLIEYLHKKYNKKNELLREVCERFEDSKVIDTATNSAYLFSMTANIDGLPMWTQYAENGGGCCLIFDSNFFDSPKYEMQHDLRIDCGDTIQTKISTNVNKAQDGSYIPYRIAYIDEEDNAAQDNLDLEIQDELDKMVQAIGEAEKLSDNEKTKEDIIRYVAQCLEQIRFLFKSKNYEYEKEYRLVKIVPYDSDRIQLDNDAKPIPRLYIEKEDGKPLKYSSIILGPKVYQTNEIIPYLCYVDQDIQIQKSKVKYR